jgi:lipid-A-disaccharide synthase
MKYFLIAGEASGDMHAAALMTQIKQRDPQAQFVGLGGSQMATAECRLYQDIRHMAFMGFAAVLANMGQIRRNFRIAEEALLQEKPDALILVDYPSFNLRIAAFCKKHLPTTKIYYYIPPKVWAWKRRRIHRIAQLCDEVLGIFPFEPAFYAQYGYRCTYVGNPTAEQVALNTQNNPNTPNNQSSPNPPTIAILPGSRESEIRHCLPKMLEAARRFPDYRIVVCAVPGIDEAIYRACMREGETLTRETYEAVRQAKAAVVNSGTATLETALLGTPQVAVYHLACSGIVRWIRPWIQPLMFSIPYFTLVNIICGKEVIRELLGEDFTTEKVTAELQGLLTDEAYTKEMLVEYEHLSALLGTQPAAATAAQIITSKR